ncbi:MAG TPA: hypothetical protein VF651_10920 [Gammaproteobacteria bacterium]
MSSDYEIARQETVNNQSSNAEAHDRAILTLSSAFLALSVSFLHDGFKDYEPRCSIFLYLSWFLFTGAIVITVFSYSYSQRTADYKLSTLQTFFREADKQEKINNEIIRMGKNERKMNDWASALFIAAVLFTVIFVTINAEGERKMGQHDIGRSVPSVPMPTQPTPATSMPGKSIPSTPVQPAPQPAPQPVKK